MSGWDSPPPMIVQLREELAALILNPEILLDPTRLQLELDRAVCMCDSLMTFHPELTRGADGKRWEEE